MVKKHNILQHLDCVIILQSSFTVLLHLVISVTLKGTEGLSRFFSFSPSFIFSFSFSPLCESVHHSLSGAKTGSPCLYSSPHTDTFITASSFFCFFLLTSWLTFSFLLSLTLPSHVSFSLNSAFCLYSCFLSNFSVFFFLIISSLSYDSRHTIKYYDILRAADAPWSCTCCLEHKCSCNITYYTHCIIYYLSTLSLSLFPPTAFHGL